MATIPTPWAPVAGDDATAARLLTFSDALKFLLGSATSGGSKRPLCRATLTVAQTLTTGVATALSLNAETVDYDNGHLTAGATTKYTANASGWHDVSAVVSFDANATGVRLAYLAVNGAAYSNRTELPNAGGTFITAIPIHTDLVYLNAGDYLEVYAQHTAGANLQVNAATLCVAWRSN